MLQPDRKEFRRLASEQGVTLVPVVKTISADLLTPVSAFLKIAANEPESFLLESVEGGEHVGRYTYLGTRPYMVVTPVADGIEIRHGRKREVRRGDVLKLLGELLLEHKPSRGGGKFDLPPFSGGAVGFFAYDFVRRLERIPQTTKDDLHAPDFTFMFFNRLLAFDHVKQQIQIIATANVANKKDVGKEYDRAVGDIAQIERSLAAKAGPIQSGRAAGASKIKAVTSKSDFMHSVRRAKEYIAAGDVYQVVLSQRFDLKLKTEPFAVYRALRRVNPLPKMVSLRVTGLHVLRSSRESQVKVPGSQRHLHPIAGTRQ